MLRLILSILRAFWDLFTPTRPFTTHARERMRERRISETDIHLTIAHGMKTYKSNSVTYSIGKREVKLSGEKLKRLRGIRVVVARDSGVVITAFRREYAKIR